MCRDTLGEQTGCFLASLLVLSGWAGIHVVTEFVQPFYQRFFLFPYLLERKTIESVLTAFLSFALMCMFLLYVSLIAAEEM